MRPDSRIGARYPDRVLQRIAALDLVRGVAVLGILAVNISGFAGPIASTDTPALIFAPHTAQAAHASLVDEAAFAFVFLIFEGKMRALFSMLFGASMLLFIERAEAQDRDGEALQVRRLMWLGCFGYLHYLLFWWGDILFVYAACGLMALALRHVPLRAQLGMALAIFIFWHVWGMIDSLGSIVAEEHVRLGSATLAEARTTADGLAEIHRNMAGDLAQARLGFGAAMLDKFTKAPAWPLVMTFYTVGETLPLMLLGMVLYRSGFFEGRWRSRMLRSLAIWGMALGGAWTLALLAWAWTRHFPPLAMPDVLSYWAGPEHLLMALAYAALLMLTAPRLLASRVGQRLAAAGRMAFSNYLGTTMVMTALFSGWGLGLIGKVGRAEQLGFVLLGWALMLGWSRPWLARFRQGPLEWLWRSLTEMRAMPMR